MELQKVKDLVLSKGKSGLIEVDWSEIDPLLNVDIDNPDKKKRFKMKLKSSLAEMGLDFMFVGNTVRFNVKSSDTPSTVNKTTIQQNSKPLTDSKLTDFLDYADDNPGNWTDFGHDYIFPSEFEYVKFALEDPTCFPLLVGNASTGKSRMCEEIAKRLDRHDWDGNVIGKGVIARRMNMEEIEESADLVGSPQLITNPKTQTSETIFVPGPLLEGWIKGWVIILDEIDRSSKAARKQLNMITEIGGKLMVPTHKGFKFFKKHPDTRIIFTANTWGHGDFNGMYDGAEPLNTAWLSRIGPKFEIKTDWSVFQEVLRQYDLPEKVIYMLFEKDGGAVQNMYSVIKTSNLQENITLRSFIRFAKCYKKFGWHYGLETCIIHEFKEFNWEKMRMAISSKCGNHFKPRANFNTVVSKDGQVLGINSEEVQTELRKEGL